MIDSPEQYAALSRTLAELPFATAVQTAACKHVFDYLRRQPPAHRDLAPLGPGDTALRVWMQRQLAACAALPTAPPPPPQPPVPEEPGLVALPVPVPGATLVPDAEWITADGFELLHALGSGGSGQVFAARALGRPGAPPRVLKIIGHEPFLRESIGREALHPNTLTFGCEHRNVVRVYGCGPSNFGLYVQMEYVAGLCLAQWLERYGPLGERAAAACIAVIAAAAAAVYTAHHQLIHRDIKPSNILGARPLETDPRRPDPHLLKLGDFGLARQLGVPEAVFHPEAGAGYGTVGYMPPEQLARHPATELTAAADVFALGVTLVELALGQRPFRAEQLRALGEVQAALRAQPSAAQLDHLRTQYAALMDRARFVSGLTNPYLRAIVQRCLAPHPAHRYADAHALAVDFDAWLNDRPVHGAEIPYRWSDRWGLFWCRCRRPEPTFDADKAQLWAWAFLVLVAPVVFGCLAGTSVWAYTTGQPVGRIAALMGMIPLLWSIGVILLLRRITRGARMSNEIQWFIGTIIGGETLLSLPMVPPTDYAAKIPPMWLFLSAGILLLGLSQPLWRFCRWLGAVYVVVGFPLVSYYFQQPDSTCWGGLVLGIGYSSFIVVLALAQLLSRWGPPVPSTDSLIETLPPASPSSPLP